MRLRLDYGPGDRVYVVKRLRLGAKVRSGLCTEIIANETGTFARVENHGLVPAGVVYVDQELAQAVCKTYNEKQERGT